MMASLYAICLTQLSALPKACAAIIITGVSLRQFRQLSRVRVLSFTHSEALWSVTGPVTLRQTSSSATPTKTSARSSTNQTAASISGKLISGGYRSGALLVIVIQLEDTQHYRVAIWRDQVEPLQFSFLHYQLAYGTEQAVRRTSQAWIRQALGQQAPRSPDTASTIDY